MNAKPPPPPNAQQVQDAHSHAVAERLDRSIREGKQFGPTTPFDLSPIAPGWILCHILEHPTSEGGIIYPEHIAKRFMHFRAIHVGPAVVGLLGHEKPRTVTEPGQEFLAMGAATAHVHRGVSLYFINQDSVLAGIVSRPVQP